MNSSVKDVTIIGAGIAGLATAIALEKRGIEVKVYEKAKRLEPIGTNLSLFPNGLRMLDFIEPQAVKLIKKIGSQIEFLNIKKSSGETLVRKPVTLVEKYGYPMINIRWSRLQEILASFLSNDIIYLDHKCKGFEQNENVVTVFFEEKNTVTTDLLIGCDGINSIIRKVLFNDSNPRFGGKRSWRSISKNGYDLISPNEMNIMSAPEGKTFVFGDAGEGYVCWAAGILSTNKSRNKDSSSSKLKMLEEFKNWDETVKQLIEKSDKNGIVELPAYHRLPLSIWSKDRVTLLGDAAHAMGSAMGQGANTSFEDAYELAFSLSYSSSLKQALIDYEKKRIQRAQIIQHRSLLQGSRVYKPDNEKYLKGIAEKSEKGNDEFTEWLYTYQPSTI